MGMMGLSSGEGPSPMPDPRRFEILRSYNVCNKNVTWAIMEILYPDCTNYEGRKILVYKGTTTYRICGSGRLDPHFNESGLAPFARFEPTEEGWKAALTLARA